jgi:hypothetical protein
MFAYRNSYQFYYHIHKRNKQKYKINENLLNSEKTNTSSEKPFFDCEKL